MRPALIAVLAAALTGCQTVPLPGAEKAEVKMATQNWLAAFNSCDADRATALYDSEPVLWGTVASTIISSATGVHQYFERVCSANPQPKVAIGDQLVRIYGDTAINSGTYTFTVFPGGKPRSFPARYSFTYRRVNGQWLIVDHHSSALPAAPASAPTPVQQ